MNKDNSENTSINHTADLPFSQACENNKRAILNVLQQELKDSQQVLEIGSGTGQHSIYFAPNLSHLQWQTSDVIANHWAIKAWHAAHPVPNLYEPLAFNLASDPLPTSATNNRSYDAIFTANTLHIISWALVEQLFRLVADALPIDGKLIVYGPFNENGNYTSSGNQRFDMMLRQGNPDSGIRDKEKVMALAMVYGLTLYTSYEMPANNQLLVFQK
jgi:cyclopropane fatty-acyl-phospholipid synthase-like methyltransferase